jgi:hypothetical protein
MKDICSNHYLITKVDKKKISEILSKQKELIFDEAKKGYRLGCLNTQQRIESPCRAESIVLEDSESEITKWKGFVDDWRNEMVKAFQQTDESLGDEQRRLKDLIRNCLQPLEDEEGK